MTTQDQLDRLIEATDIIDDVANGPYGTVTTEQGEVVTVSKAMEDMAAFNPRGAWATGTSYLIKDLITESGTTYAAVISHTSGVFLTDLADGKLAVYYNKTRYDADNVDKVLTNNTDVSPGTAFIGQGYQGPQYYGRQAIGHQHYGELATGYQFYGQAAIGDQYYGQAAIGDQYYGHQATGGIEIGSALGAQADKILIAGTKEATFEDIIDAAGVSAWVSPTLATGHSGTIKYRLLAGGKNIQFKGTLARTTGTSEALTLSVGARPDGETNFFVFKYSDGRGAKVTISVLGVMTISTIQTTTASFDGVVFALD